MSDQFHVICFMLYNTLLTMKIKLAYSWAK